MVLQGVSVLVIVYVYCRKQRTPDLKVISKLPISQLKNEFYCYNDVLT